MKWKELADIFIEKTFGSPWLILKYFSAVRFNDGPA